MRKFIHFIAMLALACIAHHAQAGCKATSATLSFSDVTIFNGAPVGTVLGTTNASTTYTCTEAGQSYTSSQVVSNEWSFQLLVRADGGRASTKIGEDQVYPTNLAGVGIAFRETSTKASLTNELCWRNPPRYQQPCKVIPNNRCTMPGSCNLTIEAKLIKTGSITGGSLSTAKVELAYYAYAVTNGFSTNSFIGVSGMVRTGTCKTSDVTVPLGSWRIAQMGPIGSTGPAKDFDVVISNCPSGIGKMSATFQPATSVLATGDSDFAINTTTSTARGIGIRIADDNGAVPLNRPRSLPYTAGAAGVTYRMKAMAVRSEENVKPGKYNSALQFTMTYQ